MQRWFNKILATIYQKKKYYFLTKEVNVFEKIVLKKLLIL